MSEGSDGSGTSVSSFSVSEEVRTAVFFVNMSTDALRAWCSHTDAGRATWSQWTREMMLAFCHNRWPQGYYIQSSGIQSEGETK